MTLALLFCLLVGIKSQQEIPQAIPQTPDFEAIRASADASEERAALPEPAVPTAGEELAALRLQRQKWVFDYERRAFEWHDLTSRVIFFLVMGIILSGIILAFIQFKIGLDEDKEPQPTQIKFGQTGVEISSSVMGILILVISLAFFYLYLTKVYELTVMG